MATDKQACSTRNLPGYDEALTMLLAEAPLLPREPVALASAAGRWLREVLAADRDQPPFDRSAMDGFAVAAGSIKAGQWYDVQGAVPAGVADDVLGRPMAAGKVMRIATGAPLPQGADATIPIELATVETGADGAERVRFDAGDISPWQHIHRRASDAQAGAQVVAPPLRLRPQHIGIAAAVGQAQLAVSRRPQVVVLSTGDEVRPYETPTASLGPQQIRNSNAPMLHAILQRAGAELVRLEHVPDETGPTRDAAERAAAEANLVITVGGVSVGQRDLLPSTWEALGARRLLHGVAIQPGKPVLAARLNDAMILGLPGNPVSVFVTAHLFLLPLLAMMCSGDADGARPRWIRGRLAQSVKAKASREVIRPIRIEPDGRVSVLPWQGSGDLMHTAAAEGFARLPLQDEPVPADAEVPVMLLDAAG